MTDILHCYTPGTVIYNGKRGSYPMISITGSKCELNCKHCRGILLKHAIPATTPSSLLEKCTHLHNKGIRGVLVSGGCNKHGQLPWTEFLPALKKIKSLPDMTVSIHGGMFNQSTAEGIKKTRIDQVLLDICSSNEVYSNVYNLENGVEKLNLTLEAAANANLTLVPHIILGFHQKKIISEYKALEMVAKMNVDALIIVFHMPLPGTPMAQNPTPADSEITRFFHETRKRLPNIPIKLGCARPRHKEQLELMALDAGFNGIALPGDSVLQKASSMGYNLKWQNSCCSVKAKEMELS